MSGAAPTGPLVRDLPIINKRGLHARAAAKFVQTAERFEAIVTVLKDGHTVGGSSIMGLMMLAASPGTSVRVVASGPQAEEAIQALTDLFANRFGEEE
ncbi:MAG: HPr family phosphocarrier protein [Bauldia sp.]|nr:HPr family phosphocarrier protein [Bauldia sp.]